MSRTRLGRLGFTLVELLIVVAIVAVIAGIAFPVFGAAKRRSYEAPCISNLRQLFIAHELYSADHDAISPPAVPNLLAIGSYSGGKEIYRCPSENKVVKGADGLYPGRLGFLWLESDEVRSPWRISYLYVKDYASMNDSEWKTAFEKHTDLGLFACPWHGRNPRNLAGPYTMISMPKMDGPVLRMCFDGHVKRINERSDLGWIELHSWFF